MIPQLFYTPPLQADQTQRPNIILCMADDQGWGDVGYYGHPHLKTPVLDEMAASGLRFDQFYAACPVCSPTRGSVMTGRHPNRFGCFSWGNSLRPQELTIAELLKEQGYRTGHFGKWHLGSVREGSPVNPGNSGFDTWLSSPNFYENSPLLSKNGHVVETDGESSMVTVDAAVEFMKDAKKEPFLAVIWFGNPHTPHVALPKLKKQYADLSKAEQNYYGELTGIDESMGRLRESLSELGIRDDTLLWYTSDNGPQGRSPGNARHLRGVKGSIYEGGMRVPTIIEWPKVIDTPRITQAPGNTLDILPTVLDLIGVEAPHDRPIDGVSLKNVISGNDTPRTKPMPFWSFTKKGISTPSALWMKELQDEQQGRSPVTKLRPLTATALLQKKYTEADITGHAALRDGDFKLHFVPGKNGSIVTELYNLKDDPSEKTNLAEKDVERTRRMTKQLHDWQLSVIGSLNGDDY